MLNEKMLARIRVVSFDDETLVNQLSQKELWVCHGVDYRSSLHLQFDGYAVSLARFEGRWLQN